MRYKKTFLGYSIIILFFISLSLYQPPLAQAVEPSYEFLLKWGSYGSGNSQFSTPFGVAVDSSGYIYVADTYNNRIQKFTSAGVYVTQWGTYGTGDGQLKYPRAVAVDSSGYVYVADWYNYRIQKFTSTGTYVTQWGSYGTGDGQFNNPYGVSVDSSGNVYVADTYNHRIQKFTSTGTYVSQWGSSGTGDGQFRYPCSVPVDSEGNVYVTEWENNRVQKFFPNGTFILKWGSYGTGDGQFNNTYGAAVDSLGNVYVADTNNNRMQKFTSTGTFITKWGTYGTGDGEFNNTRGVAVDSLGSVFVSDAYNNRIQKFIMAALTVTAPNGGESWMRGAAHTLTWTSTGNPGDYVKIELLKADALDLVITDSTPNDGSYSWTTPADQPLDTDYKIRVTSTAYPTITDSSDADFTITVSEELTVTSPNGGENWIDGTTHAITWTSSGSPTAYVKIELLKAGALNKVLASSTPNDGSYDWAIPMTQALGADYSVRITRTTAPGGGTPATDTSDAYFSLIAETLTVTSPNGGENWMDGTTHAVTWTSTGSPTAYVRIELLKAGVLNRILSSSTPNDGSFDWVIPMTQPLNAEYSVRITRTTYPAGGTPATDTSNTYFALVPEALTVTSPNGGESWVSGTTHSITWTSTGSPTAYVRIELLKAGVLNRILSSSTLNDGSFDWAIPMTQPLGTDYSVRITRTTYPAGGAPATDTSNSYFSVVAETLTLTSPNGGGSWVSGTTNSITWTSTGNPKAYVRIELLKAGVLNRILSSSTLNDGSFDWVMPVTQPLGAEYTVRIKRTTYPAGSKPANDTSNAFFAIAPEELTVTSPVGGEEWVSGTTHAITWASTGNPKAYVRIELLKAGVLNRILSSSTLNDGSFDWAIPMTQPLGAEYTVRIKRTTYPSGSKPANDTSDAYFSLIPEALTVDSPDGGENWVSGTKNTIAWTSTGNPKAYVRIELLKAGALNRVIASSTLNDGSFDWVIPMTQPLGSEYSVRIIRTTYPAGSKPANDTSDAYFSVVAETLTVDSPDGGESWGRGTKQTIAWTSTGSPTAYVRIELLKAGVLSRIISSSTLNDGSFGWVVPVTQALGSEYSVRITRTTYPVGGSAATDTSDAYFTVTS